MNVRAISFFIEGQEACESGMARTTNPYAASFGEAQTAWDDGWLDSWQEALRALASHCVISFQTPHAR
jgi:hypothetical protein